MEIDGLKKKEFVLTIEGVVDADVLIEEGTQEVLDQLRGSGSAEIINIQLRDKEKKE